MRTVAALRNPLMALLLCALPKLAKLAPRGADFPSSASQLVAHKLPESRLPLRLLLALI
jgi:hypothetical protein